LDDNLGEKLSDEDKKKVKDVVDDGFEWMDENMDADRDEYEDKLKEVTDKVEPIISSLYQS